MIGIMFSPESDRASTSTKNDLLTIVADLKRSQTIEGSIQEYIDLVYKYLYPQPRSYDQYCICDINQGKPDWQMKQLIPCGLICVLARVKRVDGITKIINGFLGADRLFDCIDILELRDQSSEGRRGKNYPQPPRGIHRYAIYKHYKASSYMRDTRKRTYIEA